MIQNENGPTNTEQHQSEPKFMEFSEKKKKSFQKMFSNVPF